MGRQASYHEACKAIGALLLPRAATGVSLVALSCLSGATPRGQPWTPAMAQPHGRDGLSTWRMAVLWTFREPSLCRRVHRALLRNAWLDYTSIIPATACHQSNYVETYSRSMGSITLILRKRVGDRAYGRCGNQDVGASVKNFSDS